MSKDEIIGEEEAKSWREKALQAAEILRKISQPPLVYATVLGVDKETVDNIYCRGELVYDEVIEGNVCNKCDYDGVK